MGFRIVQKSMTLSDLQRSNSLSVTYHPTVKLGYCDKTAEVIEASTCLSTDCRLNFAFYAERCNCIASSAIAIRCCLSSVVCRL